MCVVYTCIFAVHLGKTRLSCVHWMYQKDGLTMIPVHLYTLFCLPQPLLVLLGWACYYTVVCSTRHMMFQWLYRRCCHVHSLSSDNNCHLLSVGLVCLWKGALSLAYVHVRLYDCFGTAIGALGNLDKDQRDNTKRWKQNIKGCVLYIVYWSTWSGVNMTW